MPDATSLQPVRSPLLPYLLFSPLPLSVCPSPPPSTLLCSPALQSAARPHPFFLSLLCRWVVSLQKGGEGEGGAKGAGPARLLESLVVLTQGRRCGWALESADFPLASIRGHKGQLRRARGSALAPTTVHTHAQLHKGVLPLHTHTLARARAHTHILSRQARAHSRAHAPTLARALVHALSWTSRGRPPSPRSRRAHAEPRTEPHTRAHTRTLHAPGGGPGAELLERRAGTRAGAAAATAEEAERGSRERAGPRSSWRPGIFQPGR